jgi:hypothetical protein
MVNATRNQGCHYLGRVPANIKFQVEKVLDDGSYVSWIAPDRKSKKKGGTRIQVRVIEYTIDADKNRVWGVGEPGCVAEGRPTPVGAAGTATRSLAPELALWGVGEREEKENFSCGSHAH